MFVILKESELHHSIGSLIDGAHPGPKTDRDFLGCYSPKTFETAKGKKEKWWQSTGGLSQRPWVRFPAAPLSRTSSTAI